MIQLSFIINSILLFTIFKVVLNSEINRTDDLNNFYETSFHEIKNKDILKSFINSLSANSRIQFKSMYINTYQKTLLINHDMYNLYYCNPNFDEIYIACCFDSRNKMHNLDNDDSFLNISTVYFDTYKILPQYFFALNHIMDFNEIQKIYDYTIENNQNKLELKNEFVDQEQVIKSLEENGGIEYEDIPYFIKKDKKIQKTDLIKFAADYNKIFIDLKNINANIISKNYLFNETKFFLSFIFQNTKNKNEYYTYPIECRVVNKFNN
ncbi:hypothetical protein NUSPORA_01999 [Nucleospora cyclopteri]